MTEYTLEKVLTACGGDPATAPISEAEWNEAMAEYPQEGLEFLAESVWKTAREQTGFSAELDEHLGRVAARTAADPVLSRLIWYVYHFYTTPLGTIKGACKGCPLPIQLEEADRHLFYVLVALGFIPPIWKYHRSKNIPEQITLDTIRKFYEHCEVFYKRDTGFTGISADRLSWLSYYIHIPMFRLGRLEYWLQPSNINPYYVWRRESDKLTVAFPEPGTMVTEDGFPCYGADEQAAATWTTSYQETETTVTGTPFHPAGHISRKSVTLPKSEFKLLFKPKDMVAAMHIPFGGGMTPETCRKTLGSVKPFFDHYFPETPIKLIQCRSWIFGNHLEQFLAPEANLLDLHRNVYLMANQRHSFSGLSFLFPNFDALNLDKMLQDNRMRKAVITHLKAGGLWRIGSMFFVPEDIGEYGTQPYLRRWQNAGL